MRRKLIWHFIKHLSREDQLLFLAIIVILCAAIAVAGHFLGWWKKKVSEEEERKQLEEDKKMERWMYWIVLLLCSIGAAVVFWRDSRHKARDDKEVAQESFSLMCENPKFTLLSWPQTNDNSKAEMKESSR